MPSSPCQAKVGAPWAAQPCSGRETDGVLHLSVAILLAGLLLNALSAGGGPTCGGAHHGSHHAKEGIEGLQGKACEDCASCAV